MTYDQIKGALLEFIIRGLLTDIGFSVVESDGNYVYSEGNLLFINGKGSRHDADVLMNPPFQIPFFYSNRVLVECKAYSEKLGIGFIRGALGLRKDINDFEIVTQEHLEDRKNNSRKNLAVVTRNRYFYQVAVASLNGFTKPAIEFAINHKIKLISLDWVFLKSMHRTFYDAVEYLFRNQHYYNTALLLDYLKAKDKENLAIALARFEESELLRRGTELDIIDRIVRIDRFSGVYFGLTEAGDYLFLKFNTLRKSINDVFRDFKSDIIYYARIFYDIEQQRNWTLNISTNSDNDVPIMTFQFELPTLLFEEWESNSFSKQRAIGIKGDRFSKIYIFNRNESDSNVRFIVAIIDKHWLTEAKTLNA